MLHENIVKVLQDHQPLHPKHDDFVFTTPNGAPIDEANFYVREWAPMLRLLKIRPRPFYNIRHTYISYMLELGAKPLWVARQTGTSLDMIEKHYGRAKVVAEELDSMISETEERVAKARDTALQNRNLPGTLDPDQNDAPRPKNETPDESGASTRTGDRGRTGDVQLGKRRNASRASSRRR